MLESALRRSQRAVRRLTGVRARGVHLVSPASANAIEATYDDVRAEPLIEDGPFTTLLPVCLPGDELPALAPFRPTLETVLLDITNPGFSFRNHLPFAPDLYALYPDVATEDQVLVFRRYAPRSCRHLHGTVAYLSNTWEDNYYHWLLLTLPLLRVYQRLRPGVRIDHYYVGPSHLGAVRIETLRRLGIDRSQIVTTPCRGDRMLVACCRHPPPQHGGYSYRDRRGHDFVRTLFVPPIDSTTSATPRRIYVQRGTARTRRVANEEQVVARLAPLGFESVSMDGLSVAEQAALFWNAEAIVAPHGAALTNLVFARAGTPVVEIFPHARQEPSLFAAATHSGLVYHYLRGDPPAGDSHDRDETVVNLDKLDRLLTIARLR